MHEVVHDFLLVPPPPASAKPPPPFEICISSIGQEQNVQGVSVCCSQWEDLLKKNHAPNFATIAVSVISLQVPIMAKLYTTHCIDPSNFTVAWDPRARN